MIAAALIAWALRASPAPWPTKGWAETTPEAAGLDARALAALDAELATKHGNVDSMLVIRRGRVAYEKIYERDYSRQLEGKGAPGIYNYHDPAWHPYYKGTRLHTMQSVSKSVTSALIGIAMGRGEIAGTDASVMPFFSEYKIPADPRRDRMRLEHVLTMTTGIRWDEESADYTDPRNDCEAMESSEDWIRYVLGRPMAAEPGSTFVYNSGATELLSYILAKRIGKPADEYAREQLFAPLGIEYYWKRTPKGLADTEGGLYLTPRDLAKIGYLYMHDGVWAGRRILPEGWVKKSLAPAVQSNEKGFHYGYKWWLPDAHPGAFVAWGYGGQLLIVVPDRELIAVFTGWNIDTPSLDPRFALERVVAAVKER